MRDTADDGEREENEQQSVLARVAGVRRHGPVKRGVTGMRLGETGGGQQCGEGGGKWAKRKVFHTAVVNSGETRKCVWTRANPFS